MEQGKESRPPHLNAIEGLKFARTVASRISDGADAYLQAMETAERPCVEAGAFYSTFDGSLVFVIRRHTRCLCPVCTGRARFGILSMFGIVVPQEQMEAETAHDAATDTEEPPMFVVAILRGGHGVNGVPGDKPGAEFLVDNAGLVLMGNPDDGKDVVGKSLLALAGLSFNRRLNVKFEE